MVRSVKIARTCTTTTNQLAGTSAICVRRIVKVYREIIGYAGLRVANTRRERIMDRQPSLRYQLGDWCRHFNGIQHPTCRAGISYASMPRPLPCFKSSCSEACNSASFLGEQELDVKVAEHEAAIRAFLSEMFEGVTCPHCHAPIEGRRQVMGCIYAEPCGHRQYQGTLPKEKERE